MATNLIANTTNVGAVVGALPTPGVLPNGWGQNGAAADGLTLSIVAFGNSDPDNSLPFITFRLQGTTTGGNGTFINLNNGTEPAANNQQYTASIYTALVSGSLANVSVALAFDSAFNGSFTGNTIGFNPITPTASAVRAAISGTMPATTPVVNSFFEYIDIGYSAAKAVDLTLRLSGPQFEAGPTATTFQATPVFQPSNRNQLMAAYLAL